MRAVTFNILCLLICDIKVLDHTNIEGIAYNNVCMHICLPCIIRCYASDISSTILCFHKWIKYSFLVMKVTDIKHCFNCTCFLKKSICRCNQMFSSKIKEKLYKRIQDQFASTNFSLFLRETFSLQSNHSLYGVRPLFTL